jgi:hypothetical protein
VIQRHHSSAVCPPLALHSGSAGSGAVPVAPATGVDNCSRPVLESGRVPRVVPDIPILPQYPLMPVVGPFAGVDGERVTRTDTGARECVDVTLLVAKRPARQLAHRVRAVRDKSPKSLPVLYRSQSRSPHRVHSPNALNRTSQPNSDFQVTGPTTSSTYRPWSAW